jgi:cation transporter-like permease
MEDKKKLSEPIPAWAWLFAAACGIIPVLTLGGAIPGAIGFGGAAGCIAAARDSSKPLSTRITSCAGITVLCWVLVIALVGGIATFSGKP